jgi:hypothetical protein
MYVPLKTLRRAVRLAGDLAELDDPAGFAAIVLPGLATLVGCDMLTYNEIGPAESETSYADYPQGALDPATQPVFAAYVSEHPLVEHYRVAIAHALDISPRTAAKHLEHIYRKLGVTSRAAAVARTAGRVG